MRYTLLFITFTILIFSNCKREPDILCVENNKELPAITKSGQYTFGCIINGKNWVAYTDQFQQWLGSTEKIICHLNQGS